VDIIPEVGLDPLLQTLLEIDESGLKKIWFNKTVSYQLPTRSGHAQE